MCLTNFNHIILLRKLNKKSFKRNDLTATVHVFMNIMEKKGLWSILNPPKHCETSDKLSVTINRVILKS